jgi:RPA family protein
LDDGSGSISARVFGEDLAKLAGVNVGDVVLVIGRPREYGSEKYVLLEIIKKVENKKWIDVRRLELGVKREVIVEEKEEETKEESIEESVVGESIGDKIIEFVRNNDKGDGVDIQDIVNEFKDEDEVKNLLIEGELFEVKPGRVKVLE